MRAVADPDAFWIASVFAVFIPVDTSADMAEGTSAAAGPIGAAAGFGAAVEAIGTVEEVDGMEAVAIGMAAEAGAGNSALLL